MSVLQRLASALGRNDDRPNVALAETLAERPDPRAVAELVGAVSSGPREQASDAIKVLYELAERRPDLFGPAEVEAFLATLVSRNNRLVWGGMTALAALAGTAHARVATRLPEILAAADRGSVIAKDKAVAILVTLARHGHDTLPVLLDRLAEAAPNQFPTYAEAIAVVSGGRTERGSPASSRVGCPGSKEGRRSPGSKSSSAGSRNSTSGGRSRRPFPAAFPVLTSP